MKTYLYVDSYFILNLIMNSFLMMATAVIRQKNCRWKRIVFLSALHAAFGVVFTYFLWEKEILQLTVSVVLTGALVFFSFPWESVRVWLSDFFCLLLLTFFAGGAIGGLTGIFLRIFGVQRKWSFVLLVASAALLAGLFFVFRYEIIRQGHRQRTVRKVLVVHRSRRTEAMALYDTGNQLISPYTGERVVVVSQGLADKIGLADRQSPVLIPYHSIGGDGLMKAYRIECIFTDKNVCKRNVLAAVSGQLDDRKKIQMILHIT